MEQCEMRQEELDKLNWLKRAKDGAITQRKAAERIRLLGKFRWKGETCYEP